MGIRRLSGQRPSGEAGAPGASTLHDLTDVDDTGKADGDVLVYDETSGLWLPQSAGTLTDLDSLSDVNAPSPDDGDVLTWDDGGSEWVAAAPSGGPGAGFTGADTPPASPSAYDDEFTGGSLDAKWTETSNAGAVAYASPIPSWVMAHFTGNQYYSLQQSFSPGSAAFSITVKYSCGGMVADAYAGCSINVNQDATNCINLGVEHISTGTTSVRWHKTITGTPTYNIQYRYWPNANGGYVPLTTAYLHLQRDASNNWRGWFSVDGVGWYPSDVSETAIALTLTVASFDIGLNQNGQTERAWVGIDWCRVNWLTL